MLMAAALSIVAALGENADHPARAAERIVEHYTDRLAKPEFRLLQRVLVSNDVFANAVVARLKVLRDLDLGPLMGWRDRLTFDADEGVSSQFGKIEQMVALGDWSMAMTSPAMAETPVASASTRSAGAQPAGIAD